MSAEAILTALLLPDAAVTAIVGDSVCHGTLPERLGPPALVLRLVSDVPQHDVALSQAQVLMAARVQVDCITEASAFAQRVALRLAVERACHGQRGTVAGFSGVTVRFLNQGPDLPHERAGLAACSVDFRVTYLQPAA